MVIASIWGTVLVAIGAALALWSLWWIIQAARTNPSEREAEDEARAAVARGEGWADEGGAARVPFSDAEIADLSTALAPESLEEAGVEARPRGTERKGPFNRR